LTNQQTAAGNRSQRRRNECDEERSLKDRSAVLFKELVYQVQELDAREHRHTSDQCRTNLVIIFPQ
jgi:hypothetical protein